MTDKWEDGTQKAFDDYPHDKKFSEDSPAIEAEVIAEQKPRKVWSAETVALHFGDSPSLDVTANVLNIAIADAKMDAAPQPCPKCEKWRDAEHNLAAAYLRIRQKVNAFDTPFAPTADQVYEITEAAIDALQAKVKEVEKERDAAWSINPSSSEQLLRAKVAELELYVGNLLARIHRDGGHYQAEHGNLKAVRAADIIVAKLNAQFDEQSALIEQCDAEFFHIKKVCLSEFGLSLVNENVLAAIAAHRGQS